MLLAPAGEEEGCALPPADGEPELEDAERGLISIARNRPVPEEPRYPFFPG